MSFSRLSLGFCIVILLVVAHSVWTDGCPFSSVETTRITNAIGQSRTGRDNARCICCDKEGIVHMVWEDKRTGNFEIYYAALAADSVKEVRITRSRGESTYPCVACDSSDVYILWQEKAGKVLLSRRRRRSRRQSAHCLARRSLQADRGLLRQNSR
jgi:hypothetical protein